MIGIIKALLSLLRTQIQRPSSLVPEKNAEILFRLAKRSQISRKCSNQQSNSEIESKSQFDQNIGKIRQKKILIH